MGSEIEEVGLVKTKVYRLNQVGIFDDNTRGLAGGKLLGSGTSTNLYRGPSNYTPQVSGNKDTDGDTIMTGVNKIRPKWVSKSELERRRSEGNCIRCGKKGHRISNCLHCLHCDPRLE